MGCVSVASIEQYTYSHQAPLSTVANRSSHNGTRIVQKQQRKGCGQQYYCRCSEV